jgi:hypothetical protein
MHSTRQLWPERQRRLWPLFLLVVLAIGWAPAQPAQADELLVLESSTLHLKPGDVTRADSVIEVPRDAQVTLVSSSGGVLRIDGPWRGTIGGAPDAGGGGLIGRLVALLQSPPTRTQLGATRSAGTCLAVDLEHDRDLCVAGPTCVVLQSRDAGREPLILQGPDQTVAEAPAAPQHFGWTWPRDLDLQPGTYLVSGKSAVLPAELRIHRQPELPSRAHTVAWMTENGCEAQARDLLRRLAQ